MHLLNSLSQYKAYKDDKSNFASKRMLFAKVTQAHAAFGRGFAISSDGYFCDCFGHVYTLAWFTKLSYSDAATTSSVSTCTSESWIHVESMLIKHLCLYEALSTSRYSFR